MDDNLASLIQMLSQPNNTMGALGRLYPQQQPNRQALQTQLPPEQEAAFQQWVNTGNVPMSNDYDMRGYWTALQQGKAQPPKVDPNDGRLHYPDTFKLPGHETLSSESKYAGPDAPSWKGDELVSPSGKVVFQDTPDSVVRKGGKNANQ